MKKVNINDGIPYEANGHFDVRAIKLHSKDISNTEKLSLGVTHFLPGGGTEYLEPPVELIYFVLDGEITVYDKEHNPICVLKKHDSINFAPKEGRMVLNDTNYPASMLVIASPLTTK